MNLPSDKLDTRKSFSKNILSGIKRYYAHDTGVKGNNQQNAEIVVVTILYIDKCHKICNFITIMSDDYNID